MKRVEIMANHSVEEDVMEILDSQNLASHYTKIPQVHGEGNSDPKQGDAVWPEENFLLIIYTDPEKARRIDDLIKEIKDKFPKEGIRCFISS